MLSILLSIVIARYVFEFSPVDVDLSAFLFQAKVFAGGRLSMPAPPNFGFGSTPNLEIADGRWFSGWPPGSELILALGVLVHAPWLIPPLLSAAMLILAYLAIKEAYNAVTAQTYIILLLISPAFLLISGCWWSENTSRAFLAGFLLFLIKFLNRSKPGYAVLAGVFLGFAFLSRIPNAVAVGGIAGIFGLFYLCSTHDYPRIFRLLGYFLPGFALMLILWLLWNYHCTGDMLKPSDFTTQVHEGYGFGWRGAGPAIDISKDGYYFSPAIALQRLPRHTLPSIFYNTFGWGKYQTECPRGLYYYLKLLPVAFTLFLMMVPLFARNRSKWDLLFLWIFLGFIAVNFFWHDDQSIDDFTAVGVRYYNEAILLGIIPLVSRGLIITYNRICQKKLVRILFYLLLAGLFSNTILSHQDQFRKWRNHDSIFKTIPKLARELNLNHAVIFIKNLPKAPIGEYPFVSIENANIIYYRLGPAPRWGLMEDENWQDVYRQWFQGREAYLFNPGNRGKGIPQSLTLLR